MKKNFFIVLSSFILLTGLMAFFHFSNQKIGFLASVISWLSGFLAAILSVLIIGKRLAQTHLQNIEKLEADLNESLKS